MVPSAAWAWRDRHAGREAADAHQPHARARGEQIRARAGVERDPHVRPQHHRPREALGRDADDRDRPVVEGDGSPDEGRIAAELLLPALVARDGHQAVARRLVFVGPEEAARLGPHLQHVEVIAADELAVDPDGRAAGGEAHRPGLDTERGQVLQHRTAGLTVVHVVQVRHVVEPRPVLRAPDVHQPRLHDARSGPDQQPVHDGEDGGVGADADGERDDGHRREHGAPPQQSGREAHVLPGLFEHGGSSGRGPPAGCQQCDQRKAYVDRFHGGARAGDNGSGYSLTSCNQRARS